MVAGPVEATALGNVLIQARAHGAAGGLAECRALVAATQDVRRYTPSGDEARWRKPPPAWGWRADPCLRAPRDVTVPGRFTFPRLTWGARGPFIANGRRRPARGHRARAGACCPTLLTFHPIR